MNRKTGLATKSLWFDGLDRDVVVVFQATQPSFSLSIHTVYNTSKRKSRTILFIFTCIVHRCVMVKRFLIPFPNPSKYNV